MPKKNKSPSEKAVEAELAHAKRKVFMDRCFMWIGKTFAAVFICFIGIAGTVYATTHDYNQILWFLPLWISGCFVGKYLQ